MRDENETPGERQNVEGDPVPVTEPTPGPATDTGTGAASSTDGGILARLKRMFGRGS
jgi:hypothetical protein